MSRVLGIDLGAPGGLVVLTPNGGLGSVLHWQRLKRGLDLAGLRRVVEHVIETFEVGLVATERPGFWKDPRIGMAQREKQGVIRTLCQEREIRLVDYQPQTVKKAITGNGRASKEQMQRAVRGLLRFEAVDEHVADAAAISAVAMSREL